MITAGTRLGPYEIVSPLGAGGMGEVWRARDTRLERPVAIKILSPEFADNAQLKVRFEREAKTISQLTHPHICTLYDVGSDNGVEYLVMELLEGESIADRIARGPLPLADVFRYGVEVAEALERAHKAGIVHRDLKPGNVMITKSGAKLLDFGLAKTSSVLGVSIEGATQQKSLTQEGTILGTFQYMAPEQIEGLEADARTDIFALGALLYEMATGRRAFEGKTRTSLIAAIVGGEPPPMMKVQPLTPAALERVIATCLAKEPDDRWQSAHDVALELRAISSTQEADTKATVSRSAWFLAAVAAIVAAVVTGLLVAKLRSGQAPEVVQAGIAAPEGQAFEADNPALSPDGKSLALIAHGNDLVRHLWVRSLDGAAARMIENTDNAAGPFWIGNDTVGFFNPGRIRRVRVSGGAAEDVLETAFGQAQASARADGVILFAGTDGIRLLESSGAVRVATHPVLGELHAGPQWLPDGKHFLFRDAHEPAQPSDGIKVASIDGGPAKQLVATDANALIAGGFLLYRRGTSLVARRFDPGTLELSELETSIADNVGIRPGRSQLLAAAGARSLIYSSSSPRGADTQLVLVNRKGETIATVGEPARYYSPRLSHDGRRIVTDMSDPVRDNGDIWIIDVARGSASRLSYDPLDESAPVWSSDDSHVVFFRRARDARRSVDILEKSAFGTGSETVLFHGEDAAATDVSRDGRYIVFVTGRRGMSDIRLFDRSTKSESLWLGTPFNEGDAHFSPDGRWLTYMSNESGRPEVYVQGFPVTTGKWLVSRGGGTMPAWSADGRELFYLSADGHLMRVPVTGGTSFDTGSPEPLFPASVRLDTIQTRQYDVAPDGQSFLLNRMIDDVRPLNLVVNWTERVH